MESLALMPSSGGVRTMGRAWPLIHVSVMMGGLGPTVQFQFAQIDAIMEERAPFLVYVHVQKGGAEKDVPSRSVPRNATMGENVLPLMFAGASSGNQHG